jgi:hypothetical protein
MLAEEREGIAFQHIAEAVADLVFVMSAFTSSQCSTGSAWLAILMAGMAVPIRCESGSKQGWPPLPKDVFVRRRTLWGAIWVCATAHLIFCSFAKAEYLGRKLYSVCGYSNGYFRNELFIRPRSQAFWCERGGASTVIRLCLF